MKHSIKRAVASILCASLLGGAVALTGCAANHTAMNHPDDMDRQSYSFDLLASEKPQVNTSIPVGYTISS